MTYTKLNSTHLDRLGAMVAPDRISTGVSNLELHARDESHHEACLPEAVIWPEQKDEVAEIVRYANEHRIPVTGWGSGSSLEGNPIPVCGGVVLNFNLMNRILEIREEDFQADVEPGVIYQDLNDKLRHKGLFFPPDPGARATLGGMIANNASGTRTVRYGSTRHNVLRLQLVTADGEIVRIGTRSSKTSSGLDLINLFVGSEGILGLVVEATVRLVGLPAAFSAAVASLPTVEACSRAVFQIMRAGLNPAALELMSPECIDVMNRERDLGLPVSPTLFMEFHGTAEGHLADVLSMAQELCEEEGGTAFRSGLGRDERDRLFRARHELSEMIRREHPDRTHSTADVAVPISAYPDIIAWSRQALEEAGIPGYIFSHAGDGNVHLVFMGKTGDAGEWKEIGRIYDRLVDRSLASGGTATGEHGVGLGKRKYMEAEHGASLAWMRRIKDLFDPNRILNPGKLIP
ncbi:MAG: FAD-binding oxidoreductase [Deltaproteobacteria bacterium]|nr:FAD-binding oxidoreductase [Deltaproteobacteria bacterium]